MHHTDPVRRVEASRGLKTDVHRLGPGHRAAGGEHVGEQLAGEKLGHRVDESLGSLPHVEQTGHVGIPYLARPSELEPVLLAQGRNAGGRGARGTPADGERDQLPGLLILGTIKRAFAARSHPLQHAQAARQDSANEGIGRLGGRGHRQSRSRKCWYRDM